MKIRIESKQAITDFFSQKERILTGWHEANSWWEVKAITRELRNQGAEVIISERDKEMLLRDDLNKAIAKMQEIADELECSGYTEQSNQAKLMENMIQYIKRSI